LNIYKKIIQSFNLIIKSNELKRIEMNEINAVILRLKNAYSVKTNAELAEKLGLSPHSISNWQRRKKIPEKILLKCSQMTDFSLAWLNTGRGEMVDVQKRNEKEKKIPHYIQEAGGSLLAQNYNKKSKQEQLLQPSDEIILNYYPEVYASAGYGATNDNIEPQTMTVSKFFISTLRIDHIKAIDIIRIYGDSMEPDFHNGEYVIVERVSEISDVSNGNTVIANIQGDIYIKKIQKIPFKDTIILNSSNPTYDPIKVEQHNLNELSIVGIVRGSIIPH